MNYSYRLPQTTVRLPPLKRLRTGFLRFLFPGDPQLFFSTDLQPYRVVPRVGTFYRALFPDP